MANKHAQDLRRRIDPPPRTSAARSRAWTLTWSAQTLRVSGRRARCSRTSSSNRASTGGPRSPPSRNATTCRRDRARGHVPQRTAPTDDALAVQGRAGCSAPPRPGVHRRARGAGLRAAQARIPSFKQFMGTDEITIDMYLGAMFDYHWNDHAGQLEKIRTGRRLAVTTLQTRRVRA